MRNGLNSHDDDHVLQRGHPRMPAPSPVHGQAENPLEIDFSSLHPLWVEVSQSFDILPLISAGGTRKITMSVR